MELPRTSICGVVPPFLLHRYPLSSQRIFRAAGPSSSSCCHPPVPLHNTRTCACSYVIHERTQTCTSCLCTRCTCADNLWFTGSIGLVLDKALLQQDHMLFREIPRRPCRVGWNRIQWHYRKRRLGRPLARTRRCLHRRSILPASPYRYLLGRWDSLKR